MKIKRVEIIGFKSFCDRAVVQIGESITGVVGPNGCGKSNIVDAIRWCMGEQSAKHLRGKAMEDVIFAGSESRGPAPMAEVSITFDDVGFSHERLAIEKSSDEAETERAIEALPDEDAPAELLAEGSVATEVAPAAELADAPAADVVDEVPKAVFLDAEGKPIASPTEEVAEMLADQPPAFDFARYTEVTITRRLYRDGTSNYFINKTACRLRDITDFFLGTGVGTKAYAIIEQGRIGQIVSSRPADRRAIIEEAAGITKFKSKKKAAEKKLDQTRQNLMRVNDITTELDKRMGTLRRQSQKAERYRKYRAELRDIELWKASHKWLELSAEGGNVSNRLGEAREEETLSRTEWTTKDAHVLAERAELSVEERRLVVLQEQGYELENRLKLAESKQVFERREADDLEARVATGNTEIDDLNTQRERGAEELSTKRLELDELVAQVDREQADVAQRDATASEARQMLANAQGMLDEARRGLGARRTEIATADAQLESLGRRRDEATRRMERVTGETEQVSERVHELDREGKKASGQLAELRQTRIDLGDQSENFKARNELLVDEVARTEKEVDGLQRDLNKRQSRLSSLQEIQERYEGFARGTRAVMTRMEEIAKGSAIHGIVADVVRAPEALEIAVEVALGDRLGGVLVAEATVGTAAIDFLKRHSGGRSAFVPVDDRRIAADAMATVTATVTVTPTDAVVASAPDALDAHFGEVVDDGHVGDVTDVTDDGVEAVAVHDDAWESDPAGYDGLDAPASDDVVAPIAVAGGETYGGEGNPSRIDLDQVNQPGPLEPQVIFAALPPRVEPTGEGILGRMVELVEFADGYADVGKRLVDGIYVVDTLERALYWHARGVTDRLVTITGDVVDPDGTQWGGSRDKQGAGVLAQMREIRELEEMVGTLSEQLADATARLTTARQEQKQVAKAIEGLRAQQHAGDLAIMSFEKDEVRVRVELDRHRDRLNHLSNEQLELEQRLVTIAGDETAARERKQLAEDQIADLERRQLDLLAEVQDHRDRMEDLQQVLIEARVRAAQLGEKRAATESSALRIERNDAELATRTQRIRHEIEAAIERARVLRADCEQLATEEVELRTLKTSVQAELESGRATYDARLGGLTEVELAVRDLRVKADALAKELSHLELRQGQIAMQRANVEEGILERYQLAMLDVIPDFHQRAPITDTEDARLSELRELIDRMGTDINLTAIEEFAEVSQRFEFLSAQKIDLERAVDQLQKAIDKINKTSRQLFKDTFTAVNATFREVFPRLFRGGQAFLSLSMPNERGGDEESGVPGAPATKKQKEMDMLEAGIEIFAQPPGKKNTTVDQLSGGEKALTAVALVFSIFLIKPSPFCILDEVDAPLDEANVDRYNEIVREMTDRSQFIVITHNKRTMESADALYGVTMQEPGVSKLVSVNLQRVGHKVGSAGQPASASA